MKIRCGFDISYSCTIPTAMAFCLSVRPERERDLVTPQIIEFEPGLPARTYLDTFGNRVTRMLAPVGETRVMADFIVEDSGAARRDELERAAKWTCRICRTMSSCT